MECNINTIDLPMVDIEKIVPGGVLCLHSLWAYYGLTAQDPKVFSIAVRKDSPEIALPDYPPIHLYYFKPEYYRLGIDTHKLGEFNIKVYDLEKSVCDAVKYRVIVGSSLSNEVLNNYRDMKRRNLLKLIKYAKMMRIETLLKTYLDLP
jgi:predicted transcriptional regulator of viral defense system